METNDGRRRLAKAGTQISNLVNIVTANYFQVSFGRYAAVMAP